MKKNILRITILAAVAILLFIGTRESNITYSDEAVKFSGMYGTTIKFEDIEKVELRDTLPAIQRRTNGIGIFGFRKGYFDTTEFGRARLLVHSGKAPFIVVKTKTGAVIVNFRDPERTRAEHASILEKLE